MTRRRREAYLGYALLLPALVVFGAFVFYPLGRSKDTYHLCRLVPQPEVHSGRGVRTREGRSRDDLVIPFAVRVQGVAVFPEGVVNAGGWTGAPGQLPAHCPYGYGRLGRAVRFECGDCGQDSHLDDLFEPVPRAERASCMRIRDQFAKGMNSRTNRRP